MFLGFSDLAGNNSNSITSKLPEKLPNAAPATVEGKQKRKQNPSNNFAASNSKSVSGAYTLFMPHKAKKRSVVSMGKDTFSVSFTSQCWSNTAKLVRLKDLRTSFPGQLFKHRAQWRTCGKTKSRGSQLEGPLPGLLRGR